MLKIQDIGRTKNLVALLTGVSPFDVTSVECESALARPDVDLGENPIEARERISALKALFDKALGE